MTKKVAMRKDVTILYESLGGSAIVAMEKIEAYVNDPSLVNLQNVFNDV